MLSVDLTYHTSSRHRTAVTVDNDTEDGRLLTLRLEAEDPDNEPAVDRTLWPSEARALAAALLHYATEAERPR